MSRWFVGVTREGRREVFIDMTGTDPTAETRGFAEVCGPYRSKQVAVKAAQVKPAVARRSSRTLPNKS